jgi:hypothetical protein
LTSIAIARKPELSDFRDVTQWNHTTTIAGSDVPIAAGELVTVHFSAGRGGQVEAGVWEFWTIFNDRAGSTARCLQGSDPGERFRRMEGLSAYKEHWEIAATAKGIRPATRDEVIAWLNAHQEDGKFAESVQFGLNTMRVVKTTHDFHFE